MSFRHFEPRALVIFVANHHDQIGKNRSILFIFNLFNILDVQSLQQAQRVQRVQRVGRVRRVRITPRGGQVSLPLRQARL